MSFNSDGNGGYKISKISLAFLSVILVSLGMLIPAIFAYGTLTEKVNMMEQNLKDISLIQKDLNLCGTKIAIIEKELYYINLKLDLLSNDLKSIKQE